MRAPALPLLFALSVLPACGVDDVQPAAASTSATALEASMETAARAYQVPVSVLKALAWVETRAVMTPGVPSARGAWGVMQLDAERLAQASRLTGASLGQLQVDAQSNVLGAAAVLRATFDQLVQAGAALDAHEPGDWYRAVALYPGFDGATEANDYAGQAFLALERGFGHAGRLTQAPLETNWRRHAPSVESRRDGLDYSGAAAYVQSPNYTSGRSTYEFVLIHTMQGSYSGTRSWFLNTAAQVSSHYILRSSDGQITQMVAHADTAWHAQCYNSRSIGLEHEGYITDPATWYTDAMYAESAKLTAYICDRHGIPKDRAHIIGHNEVPSNCNTGGHTDPGSGWNWTKYLQLITGGGTTPGTGVLIGAIYTGGVTTNRVAGAVVTVNGQSVTTAADGVYQFTLAPGSYTAAVSKSGFTTTQVTRTVATGAQVWGSMELVPVVAGPGMLSGTVVANGQPVDGAAVTVNGQSATTAAAGTFSFSLAAGSYTVTATKSGFMQAQATQAVSSGQTATVTLTLTAVSGPDTVPPTVTLSAPLANAALELAVVDVKGTVTDDRGPVASVSLSLNGSVGLDVPVMNGAFSVPLQLSPGRNDVTVTARDAAGNQAQASVSATFNAGVAGVVQVSGDATKLVAGATVELREAATGTVVATTTTDTAGAFFAPATNVPADYLLVVRAAGYVTLSQTETVSADAQAHVVLSLVPGVDVIGELSVEFTEPADGSTVLTDTVTVYGAVHGFDAGGVRVNGVVATLLGGGGFSATVPLVEGTNTLEAVATGLRGEVVSTHVTVRRPRTTPLEPVVGSSCAAAPELLGVLAVLVLARRRRVAVRSFDSAQAG